jgi:hypothetical protein
MRWPSRKELYYLSFGTAALAILFTVLTWQLGKDMLAIGLGVSGSAVFLGLYVFTVTRERWTEFGSRVASVCLVVGFVSGALLPLITLDPIVYAVLGFGLIGIGAFGFVYFAFIEIPITLPKKLGGSRGDRLLLSAGVLLIITGSFTAFLRWFPLPIPRELYSTLFFANRADGKSTLHFGNAHI